jgi:hypothetical protein
MDPMRDASVRESLRDQMSGYTGDKNRGGRVVIDVEDISDKK